MGILTAYGQLGIGNTNNQLNPVQVAVGKKFVAIANGDYHSLALSEDGTLWTWGYNEALVSWGLAKQIVGSG